MSQFETATFQVRKYLLSMKVNERRSLSPRMCKYTTLKATAYQLKKLGCGCWNVNHAKEPTMQTIITRVQ